MQTATSHNFRTDPGYKARSTNWTSLRLLNVYRLGLAAIFFSQSFITESPLLNIAHLGLYSWTSFGFLVLSLVWLIAAWIERRGFHQQVLLQIYGDTILIILLMHACGGITSGIGMLLIISIAVTGLLAEQSLSIIFASLASLGLLAEHIYSTANIDGYVGSSTQVGILGATLFATAIVTQKLTQRVRSSERLIQQRERDVALLSALNQEVIENLQAGVIVLGKNYSVRHINRAALQMMDFEADRTISLRIDAPKLLKALENSVDEESNHFEEKINALGDKLETSERELDVMVMELLRNSVLSWFQWKERLKNVVRSVKPDSKKAYVPKEKRTN